MQENVNIPDSNITANLTFRQLVLMNMQQLTNFPYIEKDFDALTDYELLCLVVKFLNDVIANQNEQNDSITNMYNAFLALQTYVNNTKDTLEDAFNNLDNYVRNYFDNLDVQEEINNKLDQMLEDGVLEQIIEQFIQSTALWCFDTVADMKLATNFTNGSYAKTLGYYNKGDGGISLYKIRTKTNIDVIDDAFIVSLLNENLVAELIIENDCLKLKQLGLQNTDNDISTMLQKAITNSYNNYSILVDDVYNLTNTITINRPVIIKGRIGNYSNWGCSGFNCTGDKTFFILDEGCIKSTFEQLIFNGTNSYSDGYEGTCISFRSRDISQTDYRVWKNLFFKCHFTHFALAIEFYATGNISNWDFSSEILFLHCKLLNNTLDCHFRNKQSYNINFISTDFENWYSGTGCKFNTMSGVNFYGCSILMRGDFIQVERDETLTPASAFGGTLNVNSCRFEIITSTEKVFNLFMSGGTYPGVSGDNHANLNVSDCEFLIHNSADGATFLTTNLQGLDCQMNGLSFTGDDSKKLLLDIQGSSAITEYSRIIINCADYQKLILSENTSGSAYKPWLIINGNIVLSCTSATRNNNVFEINDKIHLGYDKGSLPNSFSVFVPWEYKKFKINVSGAFMGNTGTITITNSDNTFTETFTKSTNNLSDAIGEILLPYKANGDTYTITATNIWGNCYFEK